MGVRDEKKQRTRERLIAEALDLFDSAGYEHTKVEDVAREAGVSPRTVYRYFPTKAELVFAEVEETIARTCELIVARPPEESAYEAMRGAMLEMAPEFDVPLTKLRSRVIAGSPTLQTVSLRVRAQWAVSASEAFGERAAQLTTWQRLLVAEVGISALTQATRAYREQGEQGELCELVEEMFDLVPRLAAAAAVR